MYPERKENSLGGLSSYKAVSQIEVWCFCGEFNAIRSRNERKGVGTTDYSNEIKGFNNFIESNLLMDLPIVGKKYTWFKANGMAKSRIDRVLLLRNGCSVGVCVSNMFNRGKSQIIVPW